MKKGTTSKKAGKTAKTATTEPITEATPTEPTSLPPSVRGPVSGHVKVTIGKVVLIRQRRVFGTRPSNPAKQTPPKVRVEWWGAQSAALFFPKQVASRSANVSFAVDKARPTTLRFPVLCPKQNLLAYLRDMGPLHLVVLGPDGQVGRATVPDLTAIAGEPYSKPVSGWFQIVSPDPVGTGAGLTILGELHFSVMWESLSSASPISSRSPSRASASSPISRIRPPSRTFNSDYDKGSAMTVGIDDDYPNDDQENDDDLSVLIETGAANNIASDYRNATSVSKTSSTSNMLSKQNSKTVVFDLKERINSAEYNIEDEDYTDMNEESNAESDTAANVSSYYEEPTSVSTSYYNESSMMDAIPQSPPPMTAKPSIASAVPERIIQAWKSTSAPSVSSQSQTLLQPSHVLSESSVSASAQSKSQRPPPSPPSSKLQSQNQPSLAQNSKPQTPAQVSKPLTPASDNKAFSDVYTRALRLKQQISDALADSSVPLTQQSPRHSVPKSTLYPDTSEDEAESDTSALVHGLDEYATDNDHRVVYNQDFRHQRVRDAVGRLDGMEDYVFEREIEVEDVNGSEDDDESEDFLEDDLIIEALNARFGKKSGTGDDDEIVGDKDDDEEEEFVRRLLNRGGASDDEDELVNLYGKRQDKRPQTQLQQQPQISPFFNLDTITALGRVHSVRVYVSRVEAKVSNLSPFLTSFVIDYEFRGGSGSGSGDIAARMVSTALPRLATNAPKGSKECIVSFDRQDIYPIVFDGAMAERWLDSSIDMNVVATQGSGPAGKSSVGTQIPVRKSAANLGARKTIWEAHASWKCREVLVDTGFHWTGRVPLFVVNESASGGGGGGKGKQQVQEPSSKHIGDIILTVELISNPLQRVVTKRPETPKPVKEENQAEETTATSSPQQPLQIPIKRQLPPYYLFLTITTARALAIFPSASSEATTLLHLSLRLFNASTPPATTPPMPYLPPFDLSTGKLNPPLNFDYAVTVPIALNAVENKEIGVVAEVWVSSNVFPSTKTTFTGMDGGSSGIDPLLESVEMVEEDGGRRLLGLVKFPVQVLVAAVLSSGPEEQEGEMPVLLPETEYAVVDPFSGVSKGWVKGFLALGTWKQVVKVQRGVGEVGRSSPERKIAEWEKDRPPSRKSVGNGGDGRREVEKEFGERVAESTSPTRKDYAEKEAAESLLSVRIHSACGLKALLTGLIKAREGKVYLDTNLADSTARSSTVDVAYSLGPNSYVVLRVFPADVSSTTKPTSVVTPTVPRSFAPSYNYTTNIALKSIDTELIRWIQNGGLAIGEIWHRATAGTKEEEVLLGTFTVPLKKLVERFNGIQGEWIPIDIVGDFGSSVFKRSQSKDLVNNVSAAIKLSIQFKNGLELAGETDEMVGGTGAGRWPCQLKVHIAELFLSPTLGSKLDGSGKIEGADVVSVRWRYPVMDENDVRNVWMETQGSAIPLHTLGELYHIAVQEFQTIELEMNPAIISQLKNGPFVLEVVKSFGTHQSTEPVVIGSVFVDIWNALSMVRKAYRRKKYTEYGCVEGVFPIINSSSTDLGGSRMNLSLEFKLINPEDPPTAPSQTSATASKNTSALQSLQNLETPVKVEFAKFSTISVTQRSREIPLHISIERAIQLKVLQTNTLPNAFATVSWPLSESGMSLSTHVAATTANPNWKFSCTVFIPRDQKSLKALKVDIRCIDIKLWHCPVQNMGKVDLNLCIQIGEAKIDLAPLFTGCTEVVGWYPVSGGNGQVLVKVEPGENLGAALMQVSFGVEEKMFVDGFGNAESSGSAFSVGFEKVNAESDTSVPNEQLDQLDADLQLDLEPTSGEFASRKLTPTFEGAHSLTRPSTPVILPPTSSQSETRGNSPVIEVQPSKAQPITGPSQTIQIPVLPPLSEAPSPKKPASETAIEDFSHSLQRTVDELTALQELIRNRGLKAVSLTAAEPSRSKTPIDFNISVRASVTPSPTSFFESLNRLRGSSGTSGNRENKPRPVSSADPDADAIIGGGRLTLEDLDFNFEASESIQTTASEPSPQRGDETRDYDNMGNALASGSRTPTNLSLNFEAVMRQSQQRDHTTNSSFSKLSPPKSPKFDRTLSDSEAEDILNSILDGDAERKTKTEYVPWSNLSSRAKFNPSIRSDIQSAAFEYSRLKKLSPKSKRANHRDEINNDDEDSSNSDGPYDVYKLLEQRRFKSSAMKEAADELLRNAQNRRKMKVDDLDDFERRIAGRKRSGGVSKNRIPLYESDIASTADEESASDSDYSLVFSSEKQSMRRSEVESEEDLLKDRRTKAPPSSNYIEDLEIQEILERSRKTRAEALQKVTLLNARGSTSASLQKPPRAPVQKQSNSHTATVPEGQAEASKPEDGGKENNTPVEANREQAARVTRVFHSHV